MIYRMLPHQERRKERYAVQPIPVRFLTALEVARRWKMKLSWVHHCEALRPYKIKVGKELRFKESDLEEFEAYRAEWPRESRTGKMSAGRQGYDIINQEDPADVPVIESHKGPNCSEDQAVKSKLMFDIL